MKLINHINFKVRICYEVSQYSRSIDQLFQFLTCPLKYYNWPQMWGPYKIGLELLTELIKIEMWFRRQLSSSVSRVLLSSQQIQQKCTLSNQNFLKNPSNQKLLFTIHKMDVCLREKYPETWDCLPNPVSFTEDEYEFHSKIDPAVQLLQRFLIFFQNFTYILFVFCLFLTHRPKFHRESRNFS